MTPSGLQHVPVYNGLAIIELTIELKVPKEAFLVIGPSVTSDRKGLVGRQFLTRESGGKRFESLYVIKPQVVRVGGSRNG
jgi:hypothetical protein